MSTFALCGPGPRSVSITASRRMRLASIFALVGLCHCSPALRAQIGPQSSDSAHVLMMNKALSKLYVWQLGEYERTGRYSRTDSAHLQSFTSAGVHLRMLSISDSGWVAVARHDSSAVACVQVEGAVSAALSDVLDPNRCATYIPEDVAEAVSELRRWLGPRAELRFRQLSEQSFLEREGPARLGLAVRNRWYLSSTNRLTLYFRSIGIRDPEEMSRAILVAYHREILYHPEATPSKRST